LALNPERSLKQSNPETAMSVDEMLGRALRRGAALLLAALFIAALFTAASVDAQPATKTTPSAKTTGKKVATAAPVLEPKAIDILKAACARLAAARTMSFIAVASYESPSRLGPALVFTTKSEVALQRPDKLRVITVGDGPASEFYYDGKAMMAFAPAENLLAVAPPTIDGALKKAFDSAAIYFPFTDLVVADPWAAIADGLKLAFYIGQSNVVGGVKTDMVAFANDEVFMQVWIGADDKLPRMVRAQYRGDTLRLRHQVELSDWKLEMPMSADAFASSKAATASRIAFAQPNPTLPPGLKPLVKSKTAKQPAQKLN
jgi:hypothetical protein